MISVVIPSRDRPERLAALLDDLARQRVPPGGFEVLVAEDGSGDAARVSAELAWAFPVPLRAVRAPRRGPAAARNAGVGAAAAGSVVLFLGDDVVPATDDLVARHAALHDARGDGFAVLGRVDWDERRRAASPFMRWLLESGIQFAFGDLRPGPVDVSRYFYCAHTSVSRDTVVSVGGFDEDFPSAAGEDIELGVRLAEAGVVLEYHPELTVLHDHPMTLQDSLTRMERVGAAAAILARRRPDRPHPGAQPPHGLRWRLLALAEPALRVVARAALPDRFAPPAWRLLHLAAYARGYRAGR